MPTQGDAPAWSRRLTTVGVTGTNGKTTTTRWAAACLARLARPVASATTVGTFLDDVPFQASPDYAGFLATMRAMADRGGRFAAIELTSQALALGFARSWPCSIGVFTNLSQDHLDAHGSPEHYLASKAQLFAGLRPGGTAVLNVADPSAELLAEVLPRGTAVVGYAVPSRGEPTRPPSLRAARVEVDWTGTRVMIEPSTPFEHAPRRLRLRGIGEVFAENALAALSAALVAGVPPEQAAEALALADPPRGRFELVSGAPGPHVVVDYAHTPDALSRTLATARNLCEARVWVVLGAGGERDRGKREPMGAAASLADHVVLTSDNPRSEDPATIAAQIRSGIQGHADVFLELDRACAIRQAVVDAGERDVVLIAGKGHEKEQIIGARATPFDDASVAREALALRRGFKPA